MFLLFTLHVFSQQVCNVPEPLDTNPNRFGEELQTLDEEVFCINIRYHIVRRNDQSGGLNPSQLVAMHQNLNTVFNQHGIYFVDLGYDFINNDNYYFLNNLSTYWLIPPAGNPNSLVNVNQYTNAINVYIVDTIQNNSSYGMAFNIPSNALVLDKDVAQYNNLAHEVGHCLNLYHTHHNTDSSNYNYVYNNCNTAADLVCDTPVDLNLLIGTNIYEVNSNCDLIYDPNNPYNYNPDTRNIMSYTRNHCLEHFTTGQINRAKQALKNTPQLIALLNNQCLGIEGNSVICSSSTYTAQSYNYNPITWSWNNPAVATLTTNSWSATLSSLPNANGSGVLSATSMGADGNPKTLSKKVHIGKPVLQYNCPDNTQNCLKICRSSQTLKTNKIKPKAAGLDASSVWEWVPLSNNFTWTISNIMGYELASITSNSISKVQFKVRVSNSCGWSDWQHYNLPVVLCRNTMIEAKYAPIAFTCFPNKADTHFAVNISNFIDGETYALAVYDIYGRALQSTQINKTETTINTEKLTNGLYLVKISNGYTESTHKIEVKH